MYKAILDILEEKGQATIPIICEEMSERSPDLLIESDSANKYSYIKSLIRMRKEIFHLKDDVVSIRPEREPVMLTAVLHGYPGPEIRVRIDFLKNRFTYFEWHLDSMASQSFTMPQAGNIEDFKQLLYSINVWEWEADYQTEGIIVDGTSWTVKLQTKGRTYESGGLDSFPDEWKVFCRGISQLVGKKFLC